MTKQWWNDYIGLPYKTHGRTREGLDCWGLVRLVHDEVFATKLPSFVDQYEDENHSIEEAVARNREGWQKTDDHQPGDVVLFRVMGTLSHVGIITEQGKFLHVMDGRTASIERLTSPEWEKRIEGVYRYTPNAVTVSAAPHPLKTASLTTTMGAGLTIEGMVAEIRRKAGVSEELNFDGVVWVDGVAIHKDQWAIITPQPGSRVEFRALAGKGVARTLLILAVVVAAVYFAPVVAGAIGVSTAAGSVGLAATQAALTVAGTLLTNAIFPVRPPSTGRADTGPQGMPMLTGGQNRGQQYGAIPVVLGRHRFTPPLGAVPYVESNSTLSRLRMLLVWGYGPVQVSDLRMGETRIDTLESLEYETLTGISGESRTRFNSLYGQDVSQEQINIKLESDGTSEGSPWVERVIADECDKITVTLHFPEGLRQMPLEGGNSGKIDTRAFRGQVQVRQLNAETLAPITSFGDIDRIIASQVFEIQPSWFNIDTDEELEPVYRWARLSLDQFSKIILRYGAFTTNPAANPTGRILTLQQEAAFGVGVTYERLPAYGPGEEGLWDICVLGNSVFETVDRRDSTITGAGLTMSGLQATIASGSVDRAQSENVRLGGTGEPFFKRKNAFSYNVTFNVPRGVHEVRVRRTNDSTNDFSYSSGNKGRRFHDCFLLTITGYENRRPASPPRALAMTAIRVKATNQINGNIEGFTGTVQSLCLDYDRTTTTWVQRATRNPASLFRYVLQHPANAQRVADSAIDLTALVDWHNYCRTNKFMFDMVITEQRPLWDVLMDIAAAGRASPIRRDGKWSIVIDRPRTAIVQHFTPHNSWGFEGVRALPKMPHAFRVQFNNAKKGYQPDERIVYNDGYSAANATLFEGLTLPGVTDTDIVFKHARFHLAQLKLRPETYTLNVDIEHLVCNRGDLVRVTHDIPLWGLGTGRIKNRINSTTLELDEAMPMKAGTQYTIRIRLEDGSSITRTVAAKDADGEYTTITLTSSVTTAQGAPLNLFMFGELGEESVELIVTSIEPAENLTARLTLVDYSPAIYDSDDEVIPAFDSQITLAPRLLQESIKVSPTIQRMISDESVTTYLGPGQYGFNIRLSFTNPLNLPELIDSVEGQIDFAEDSTLDWQRSIRVPVGAGAITFDDVEEGDTYRIRLRYIDSNGRFGPWRTSSNHTVVGRTNPPSTVTGFAAGAINNEIELSWNINPEVDVVNYEIRTSDSGWGGTGFVFRGADLFFRVAPPAAGQSRTYFIKAIDSIGLYSTNAASVTFGASAVPNITAINETFADTSLTNATITLDWEDVSPQFGLSAYRVSYGSEVKTVKASTITLPANWIGSRTFTVRTIDNNGNLSSGYSKSITKLVPNPVSNLRAQVIDNNVLLYWDLPAKTTLPVQHVRLKKGTTWATASEIGTKDGGFTTLQELVAGTYRYWVAVVDTDGYESTPRSVTAQVSQPPDFIFFAEYDSLLDGTKSSAYSETDGILLPVDTTETWQDHFITRSWSTPQDQINAGFPIYIQPADDSGFYEETIDYGTTLASSKISVGLSGAVISGNPAVVVTISTSPDNVTYTDYPDTTAIYATNFRYFKIKVAVSSTGNDDLYKITGIEVILDAKLKNDAGTVTASASDSGGTQVNFTIPFVDITALEATPRGTTPITAVIDFADVPNPTGFKVFLFDGSGNRVSGDVSWSAKGY